MEYSHQGPILSRPQTTKQNKRNFIKDELWRFGSGDTSIVWILFSWSKSLLKALCCGPSVIFTDYSDWTFFVQAEGITIEPLTNSTEEEYDEYYDIWEGEISK